MDELIIIDEAAEITQEAWDKLKMTKTKPQTEQEMAEWLFNNVLTMDSNITIVDWSDSGKSIKNFIYSPDGFFAVWDAVEEKLELVNVGFFSALHSGDVECDLAISGKHFVKQRKDRYEAFYNAVWEAWE